MSNLSLFPRFAGVAVLGAVCVATLGPVRAAVPDVVASLKPVHALVAGVMGDLGTPKLLVQGAGSPHSYALKPSDAQALSKADIVFRVGENMEIFLNHPLQTLSNGATVIDLDEADGVTILPMRAEVPREPRSDDDKPVAAKTGAAHGDHAHSEGHQHFGDGDPHIWLDPENARAMSDAIAVALATADPEHGGIYKANAALQNGHLAALEKRIAAMMVPLRGTPFIVFHDAYRYFEHRFAIEASGSVTVNPEQQPGAARVREIRDTIRSAGAVCVFTEPQFRPHLVETLVEGTKARVSVLDPIGADLSAGRDAYERLLMRLARNLSECLGARE